MAKSNSINSTLDSLTLTDDSAKISLDTLNGFDTKSLGISAGGDTGSPGRGANIQLYGADHATNAGDFIIEAGVSGSLDLRTISSEPIVFTVGSTQRWEMQNTNNDLLYSSGARIRPQDGITNQFLTLNGGATGPADGGRFMAFGNTHAFTGQLRLEAGNVAGGDIVFQTNGTERWRVDEDGDLEGQQTVNVIRTNTTVSGDNGVLHLTGAGAVDTSRGAFISLYGEDHANSGRMDLFSNGPIGFVMNGGSIANFTESGDLEYVSNFIIRASSTDGSDSNNLQLTGGGDASAGRGARIQLFGNEASGGNGGKLILHAGDDPEADIQISTFDANPIRFATNSAFRWDINSDGDFVPASSGTYDVGTITSPVATVYANSFISEGSPGIHITHESGRAIIDTTEDNDLRIRRNGTPYIQLENGSILFTQNVIMEADLSVSGVNNIINTEQLLVEDNIITLNSTASGTPTLDSGFEVNRGDQPYSRLLWDESEDYFVAGISGSEQRIITSSGLETTSNSLRPVIDAGMDLGDASHNFEDLYVRSVQSSASSLTVGTQNASTLYFRTNATQRWQIAHTTGHLTPLTSGTIDIGTSSLPTNRVYTKSVSSPDLLDFLAGGSSQWRIASDGEFKYVGPDANAVIRKDVDGSAVAATLSLYAADVNSVLDTAAIQLSSVANGGNLDLYCGSGGDIRFFNNTGTAHWIINSAGDFLTNRSDTTLIGATTASGSDTAKIVITASDVETSSRSARISLTGNDHAGGAGPGHIDLCSGDDATGYDVQICSGPGSSAGNVKQTWRFNGDRLEFLATSVTTSLITHVNDTSKTLFLTGGDGNLNRGARLKLGGSTTADGEATAGGFRLATASSGTGVGYIDALDSVQFGTGSGYPTRLTVRNSNFNPILITSAAQTGVASPVVQIEVPDTAGNRGGYAIVAASGGGLAGMTAEVVTGGAYPNSEGILDLWYQEGASTQRALRASQADGVALYVDTTKRFELRPDRSIYHKSHDSYADSEYRRETFGYTCTGSGTETAFTLTPISNGTAWVTTRLSAFDGDNNESMWVEIKTGVVRHDSGTASLIGTQVKTSDFQGTASEFWNAEFDTSGNDLRLRVTAVSGVAFTGTFEYQQSLGA